MKTNFIRNSFFAAIAIAFGSTLPAFAQDDADDTHQITVVIPTVALLDLESATSKDFSATFAQPTPLEAGQKLNVPAVNNSLWLNYSSIQTLTTPKKVTVETSAIVPGVDINVTAAVSASGAGDLGDPTASPVKLAVAPQSLITGIGSAYTVTGPNKGHQLTYAFLAEDGNYADLRSGSTTVTVKYTLADE